VIKGSPAKKLHDSGECYIECANLGSTLISDRSIKKQVKIRIKLPV